MKLVQQKLMHAWARLGPRYLPFADVATPDLPLSRLLRLSLFQVSVGMALVLLVGTLNRVMIVELGVPASLVAIMISLPVMFAPFRALVGFRSDTHRSALGWKRVPFIWKGAMIQFGGLAIMPFAVLVLAGAGEAHRAPAWLGPLGAGLAFLLVGFGIHMTQTVGLALATDLVPTESHPKVVGLMYVMLLLGTIVSALVFGALLENYTHGRLVQVIQGSAVTTLVLNVVALWKQETRRPLRGAPPPPQPGFAEAWAAFRSTDGALRRLFAVGIGTMAFSMQDVLLEPYGGQVLNLTVAATTTLTATLAGGGLLGFAWASKVLSRGSDPFRMACLGAAIGIPAFLAVISAASIHSSIVFGFGALFVGFGGGLFSHGTLTATMNFAPEKYHGLALGAWGAVQATAAGIAVAMGGVLRDIVAAISQRGMLPASISGPATGYIFVYSLEVILLLVTFVAMLPLLRRQALAVPA